LHDIQSIHSYQGSICACVVSMALLPPAGALNRGQSVPERICISKDRFQQATTTLVVMLRVCKTFSEARAGVRYCAQ